ncbi:MAG: DUF3667 domain-containing protein [Flavobacteriales bacterium]|nr:DUF3667 domain-containing protein [Flavobacteriales bacterium]
MPKNTNPELLLLPETNGCRNCGSEQRAAFCAECGQKHFTKRFTIKTALADFFSAIFSIERGFFFTTIQTLVRPGVVVKDYVGGKTAGYFPPFRFAFIWITIYSITLVWSGLLEMQMDQFSMDNSFAATQGQNEMSEKVRVFVQTYFNFIGLLSLPFISLASKWVVDKNDGNLAEHFIANTYAIGIQSAVMFIVAPIFLLIPSQLYLFSSFGLLAGVIFLGLTYKDWLNYSIWSSIGRSIAANVMGTVMFILGSMVIGIIIGIVWMIAIN